MPVVSRIASQADFQAQYDTQGNRVPGTGNLYDEYQFSPQFTFRAQLVRSLYDPATVGKTIVGGAGFGYLVQELRKLGFDCWGLDFSQYAVGQAQQRLSFSDSSRMIYGSVGTRGDLNALKSAAGLGTNQPFGLCIIEDMHTVCNDLTELGIGLNEIRRSQFSTRRMHMLTALAETEIENANNRYPGLLWRTFTQWRTILGVGNAEPLMDVQGPPYKLNRGTRAGTDGADGLGFELWSPTVSARIAREGDVPWDGRMGTFDA